MRPFGNVDLVICLFSGIVGTIAMWVGSDVWRVRNGGVFTRVLVGILFAFGIWAYLTVGEGFYQWGEHINVSHVVQFGEDIDRIVLSLPTFLILTWVIPVALRKKK